MNLIWSITIQSNIFSLNERLFIDEHNIRNALDNLIYKLSNNLYTTRKWWEKNYGIEKTSKKLRNFLYLQYPEILENITQVSFNI